MQIRITTYHKVINRGAILQAYGLQENFRKLFPNADVKLIDNLPLKLRIYELLRAVPRKKNGLTKFKRFLLVRKDVRKLLSLDKQRLKKVSCQLSAKDLLVTGSDCIWRIENKFPFPRFPNEYWLPYKSNAKKISFSTSAYGTNMNHLSRNKEMIQRLVADYSLISVRDTFTKKMIERPDAVVLPDPSFFVPLDSTIRQKDTINEYLSAHPHTTGLQIYHKNYESYINAYINKNKESGVLGFTNNFPCSLNVDHILSTLEWINVFRHLSFVITDSFHGTIFSIRNKTPFISIETKGTNKNESKKYHLISYLGLEELYLDLENCKSDSQIFTSMQDSILERWENYFVPLINQGLVRIRNDLNRYNQKILELLE